jgi:hypothetical protein
MPEKFTSITIDERVYRIVPDMRIVCEIEDEMGEGVAALSARFLHRQWKVSELVTLIHMMLHVGGKTFDYRVLGNRMIEDGLEKYTHYALHFLNLILNGSKK